MLLDLFKPILGIVEKWVPDTDKANELARKIEAEVNQQAHEIAKQQIEVNKLDAQSKSFWQYGWRPAVAWMSIATLFINGIGNWLLNMFGFPTYQLPQEMVYGLLTGLLGIGGMRSVDKYNKTDTK